MQDANVGINLLCDRILRLIKFDRIRLFFLMSELLKERSLLLLFLLRLSSFGETKGIHSLKFIEMLCNDIEEKGEKEEE